MRYTLFISDLHLHPARPSVTKRLQTLLNEKAYQADAVYILGDFFEVWIGDDQGCILYPEVIEMLAKLTHAGTPVWFMHGNRDFLVDKKFCHQTGCQLLPDPSVIKLYHTPVLLSHGDYLCTDDTRHQWFRRWTGKTWIKRLFLALPKKLRTFVGQHLRDKSQHRTGQLNQHIMDVNAETVLQWLEKFQVQWLIHGHTHRPAIHQLTASKRRIVLGDWHDHDAKILTWYEDGTFYLNNYDTINKLFIG